MASAWQVQGSAWEVHGKCIGRAWEVHGTRMARAWQVHGKCMAIVSVDAADKMTMPATWMRLRLLFDDADSNAPRLTGFVSVCRAHGNAWMQHRRHGRPRVDAAGQLTCRRRCRQLQRNFNVTST